MKLNRWEADLKVRLHKHLVAHLEVCLHQAQQCHLQALNHLPQALLNKAHSPVQAVKVNHLPQALLNKAHSPVQAVKVNHQGIQNRLGAIALKLDRALQALHQAKHLRIPGQ